MSCTGDLPPLFVPTLKLEFRSNHYNSLHILNRITSEDLTPTITLSPTRKFKDFSSSVSISVLKN